MGTKGKSRPVNGLQHPFPPGTAVRSYGDQYPEAYQRGTATVIRSFRKGQLEYEVEYHPENPWRRLTGRDRSEWSSESTFAIEPIDTEES